MWYLYILETADGRLYTGITNHIKRRMIQHQEGKGAKFTRSFGFKKLLYSEQALTKSLALKREKQIQQLTRPQKLALMNKSHS